jgi:hypothetical protein
VPDATLASAGQSKYWTRENAGAGPALIERILMATASCSPYQGREVWLLASAAVCDAREVATEFNDRAAHPFREFFRAVVFLYVVVFHLVPGLRRLSARQARLIAKLDAAEKESWNPKDCREMSDLLYELVQDEGNFIKNGTEFLRSLAPPVVRMLQELDSQLRRIDAISMHLDALAVQQVRGQGHDECLQFLALSREPEEFDFSAEPDRKGVASTA